MTEELKSAVDAHDYKRVSRTAKAIKHMLDAMEEMNIDN